MEPQTGGERGLHMDKMGGILDLHWNITGVTRYISQKPGESALYKQLIPPPRNSRYHFLQLKIWPLKPHRNSLMPYYTRNQQAHFVRSATNIR
jgi:hypothetical protein